MTTRNCYLAYEAFYCLVKYLKPVSAEIKMTNKEELI